MRASEALVVLVAAALAALGTLAVVGASRRRRFGSDVDEATYRTLHTASRAAATLREGLTPAGVGKAAKHLRTLLAAPSIAVTDPSGVLAWDGPGEHHRRDVVGHAQAALVGSRTVVLGPSEVACGDPDCELRFAVIAPVVARDRVVAALSAYGPSSSPGLVRATEELAVWLATQAELADLGRERTRAMEAELRALRAQISPHFVYNCLAAIASFVRTDPDRARELLLEFADFTRYAFRRGGAYTTLADELRNIERYLALEQARFGDRLTVTLTIAPEVLQVSVPFLAVQPLVENAVRHRGQWRRFRPRGDPRGPRRRECDGQRRPGQCRRPPPPGLRRPARPGRRDRPRRRDQGELPGAEVRPRYPGRDVSATRGRAAPW